ncbi:hypothetical protein ACQP1S_30105 [Micromonospora matsumotoense]|uniref:hypothetical protein n=1 Tax=Micromonospora matsumotoense TaxID=121616 RepID=UPI003D8F716C
MQVKANPSAATVDSPAVPVVSIPCRSGDFESTGVTVVQVAVALPLSLDDLVMALMLTECSMAEVAEMSLAEIRGEVAYVLGAYGLAALHDAVAHDRNPRTAHLGEAERAHRRMCETRVVAAFGLPMPVPAPRRARVASRSIGARRELTTVA